MLHKGGILEDAFFELGVTLCFPLRNAKGRRCEKFGRKKLRKELRVASRLLHFWLYFFGLHDGGYGHVNLV